jgi:hypothetical protein
MAAGDRAERVEVGFAGGQVVAIKLTAAQLKELRSALAKADGWHDVESEDGAVSLDLSQIVFVRTARPDQRIGFVTGD